jgi:hypothetical protein
VFGGDLKVLEGIEILNETIVYGYSETFNWEVFWILFGIAIAIATLFYILCWNDDGDWVNALGVWIMIFIITGFLSVIAGFSTVPPDANIIDHIEYQVTISDSVNLNEFLEHYEIIDQQGKIYTIKERDK